MLTAVRLIPLPVHVALRLASGLATMLVGALVDFEPTALVLSVMAGALAAGVALAALPDAQGRAAIGVGALHDLDYGLVFGLFAIGAVVGLGGDGQAALVLCAIAAVQLVGNGLTRYSSRP